MFLIILCYISFNQAFSFFGNFIFIRNLVGICVHWFIIQIFLYPKLKFSYFLYTSNIWKRKTLNKDYLLICQYLTLKFLSVNYDLFVIYRFDKKYLWSWETTNSRRAWSSEWKWYKCWRFSIVSCSKNWTDSNYSSLFFSHNNR